MKTLRDNWAILTALATLCFFAGAAYFRLGNVERQVTTITSQLENRYVTKEDVRLINIRLDIIEAKLYSKGIK